MNEQKWSIMLTEAAIIQNTTAHHSFHDKAVDFVTVEHFVAQPDGIYLCDVEAYALGHFPPAFIPQSLILSILPLTLKT